MEAACKQPEQVENPASYTLMPGPNGVLVRLTLQEQDYCPMELTLYTPDEASAKQAAQRFVENPALLYQAILEQVNVKKTKTRNRRMAPTAPCWKKEKKGE